jgi:hypothetical protein
MLEDGAREGLLQVSAASSMIPKSGNLFSEKIMLKQ